ncbi:DUF433 domain-containing protein [Fervidibacter sacchari]|jgi:Protein of unknown function (DUF433).|uniref:Uncharacterized protein (DUF433 family) n=1 Tax=Candidatus Fervidibacter sacchari TaxID=1448929 RepID=A0ABT2ES67_9BACT|nr:DUF433 domain-containing protein [Candidatus Fervidibacter sacchari]MCS3920808.1 uncharacterized protein (DUF433 family) [Candidatus Fervidibacter sacchari]WKU17857.1 DUF433 domain-containing protein [Candidatus Fervidibacter sacchari]
MELRHYKFQRITIDPEKCLGKPCIRGLRIPELELEGIYEALGFAAEAMEERFIPLEEAVKK